MMSASTNSFLRRQILEMDRLAESSADDPLMSFAVQKRRESLEAELKEQIELSPVRYDQRRDPSSHE